MWFTCCMWCPGESEGEAGVSDCLLSQTLCEWITPNTKPSWRSKCRNLSWCFSQESRLTSKPAQSAALHFTSLHTRVMSSSPPDSASAACSIRTSFLFAPLSFLFVSCFSPQLPNFQIYISGSVNMRWRRLLENTFLNVSKWGSEKKCSIVGTETLTGPRVGHSFDKKCFLFLSEAL